MRIALLNSFYHPDEPGGAERSVRFLAESLAAAGHDVTVICLGKYRESKQMNGVRIERLEIRNRYLPASNGIEPGGLAKISWHARDSYNTDAAGDMEELLRKCRPDVLHTNNLAGFSVAAWRAARRCGIPVVHTTRDFYLICPKTTMMRGEHSCEKSCMSCAPFSLPRRLMSSRVDHVVGISRFILERHVRNGFFAGVSSSVIYNSFSASEVPYRAPGNELTLGFIGRLAPAKGVDMLLDAFRALDPMKSKLKLLIAGEGKEEYVDMLKAKAADMPVVFLGHAKPETFFPAIDLTVVPSIWNEPLGRVVIESMAFGKPVVATAVGGIPELVDTSFGLLCNELNASGLSAGIEQMLERIRADAASLHHSALKAGEKYVPTRVAQSYLDLYMTVQESAAKNGRVA